MESGECMSQLHTCVFGECFLGTGARGRLRTEKGGDKEMGGAGQGGEGTRK